MGKYQSGLTVEGGMRNIEVEDEAVIDLTSLFIEVYDKNLKSTVSAHFPVLCGHLIVKKMQAYLCIYIRGWCKGH
ncbi:hypothetical protein PNH38_10055 [Anoxybacillus rupiensis]|jgi:hypothetical protein|uniref:Uncharacterized protein n=1 Tax=Anoxybacteroides rupiense TaxID=311460 RepID=A0ABD5IWA4_9BACL|nr:MULTISPECIES: hypothetical protein [Anoxybacillus]KXG10011.1 hypothetical protein AT864_01571 [Anoxybacillus sp. P3H1B]MBB3907659.1 hypothetical protein [Anoxybacillus rupiensis]MBS2771677.1 hypothetical protein [Anoxybacillus rupiensis]MDE8564233.1 hypothetical protein [Anoxybacillus rupiensis]MED5052211.1 hypothetical protein [Anoxybacillus rupiensis]